MLGRHRDRRRAPARRGAGRDREQIVSIPCSYAACRRSGRRPRERDLALERAVLDLHLLVDAARRPCGRQPLAGDDEHALADDDLDARRVDARKLDDARSARAARRCGSSRRSGRKPRAGRGSAARARARRRARRARRAAGRCRFALWRTEPTAYLRPLRLASASVTRLARTLTFSAWHWTRLMVRIAARRRDLASRRSCVGGFASTKLAPLLSNTFAVPGTDSERVRHDARAALRRPQRRRVHRRLHRSRTPATRALRRAASSAARPRRAGSCRAARPTRFVRPAGTSVFGDIVSTLNVAKARATPTSC